MALVPPKATRPGKNRPRPSSLSDRVLRKLCVSLPAYLASSSGGYRWRFLRNCCNVNGCVPPRDPASTEEARTGSRHSSRAKCHNLLNGREVTRWQPPERPNKLSE